MDPQSFIERAKSALKKLQQMQEDLKQGTTVEKLTFPEAKKVTESSKDQHQVVDVSAKSVARATIVILAILALAYFLYEIKGLLILFFISLFFASALEPFVDWLEKRRIPRSVGVILILLLFFSVFVLVIGSAIPIIVEQITLIATNIGQYFSNLFENLKTGAGMEFLPEAARSYIIQSFQAVNLELIFNQLLDDFADFMNQIKSLASGVGSTVGVVGAGVTSITLSIAEFFFSLVLVFFLVFFMVVDRNNLQDFFQSLFPRRYGEYISTRIRDIQLQMGAWLRGTFLLVLIMFTLTFIGLIIIGMEKYAFTLALIMGIGAMIPYIGPLIFLTFSLPVALGTSITVSLKLIAFYVIIQTVEGNILVPAVMKRVVGLSPIIILLVLLIGWHFLGILGAIIAVPVTTAVAMFVRDYINAIREK